VVPMSASSSCRSVSGALELHVDSVTVRRGRRAIVEGLSLTHGPGTVAWLVGDNGGGKSSLMRVLAGLDAPQAGSVARRGPPGSKVRAAYYHPGMRLPPVARVSDWQNLVARLALPEREVPGLAPPFAKPRIAVSGISTGEEKRLILDPILAAGRDFLFLDEPFEHLSPDGKEILAERLGRLARARVVVVATNQAVPAALVGGPVIRLEPEAA